MPTTNYRSTTGELIEDALYLVEAIEEGEPLTTEHEAQGIRGLSRLIASWQSQSEHVWTLNEGVLPVTGAQRYSLGRTVSSAIQGVIGGTFTAPTQASPAPSEIDTIDVEDVGIEEFNVGTSIIITKVDETPHVTTVASKFGNDITLTDSIPYALEGGSLFYGEGLSIVFRPFRLMNMRRSETLTGTQIPVDKVSRETFMNTPNKASTSSVTQFYYDRNLEEGFLYVWGTGSGYLHFTFEKELQKPTAVTDVLDFPEEWFDAIIYNLANRLAPMYATNPIKRQLIKAEAEQLKAEVLAEDSDCPYVEIG